MTSSDIRYNAPVSYMHGNDNLQTHFGAFLSQYFFKQQQRWEVVEYKYFVTVLEYIFLVPVLYSTTFFSDDFLLLLLTFVTQIPVLSTSYIFKTGSLL